MHEAGNEKWRNGRIQCLAQVHLPVPPGAFSEMDCLESVVPHYFSIQKFHICSVSVLYVNCILQLSIESLCDQISKRKVNVTTVFPL